MHTAQTFELNEPLYRVLVVGSANAKLTSVLRARRFGRFVVIQADSERAKSSLIEAPYAFHVVVILDSVKSPGELARRLLIADPAVEVLITGDTERGANDQDVTVFGAGQMRAEIPTLVKTLGKLSKLKRENLDVSPNTLLH